MLCLQSTYPSCTCGFSFSILPFPIFIFIFFTQSLFLLRSSIPLASVSLLWAPVLPTPLFDINFSVYIRFCIHGFVLSLSVMSNSCNTLYCSPPGAPIPGILQARTLEWVPFPPPGIFPTQESNPGPLHCRQTLNWLSYEGSPIVYIPHLKLNMSKDKISVHVQL